MRGADIEEIEVSITAFALKAGVVVSVALMVAGMLLEMVRPETATGPLKPEGMLTLPGAIFSGSGIATLHLGLLVLMATPLVRVIVLTCEFTREHDYSFAIISTGVLLLLFLSFVLGAVG